MESAKSINKRLLKTYGKDVNGYAMYQIVQNGRNLIEKRSVFSGLYLFGKEQKSIKEVPKYTYIDHGLWILEKLFYTTNEELATTITYEPIWTFTDPATGGYQEPVYKFIELIIKSLNSGPTKMLSELEEDEKTKKEFYEFLGGKPGRGNLDGTIADGSAVSYSGLDGKNLS